MDDRSLLTYNKKYRRPHPVIKVTSEKNSTQRICVKILIILIKLAVYSQFFQLLNIPLKRSAGFHVSDFRYKLTNFSKTILTQIIQFCKSCTIVFNGLRE